MSSSFAALGHTYAPNVASLAQPYAALGRTYSPTGFPSQPCLADTLSHIHRRHGIFEDETLALMHRRQGSLRSPGSQRRGRRTCKPPDRSDGLRLDSRVKRPRHDGDQPHLEAPARVVEMLEFMFEGMLNT